MNNRQPGIGVGAEAAGAGVLHGDRHDELQVRDAGLDHAGGEQFVRGHVHRAGNERLRGRGAGGGDEEREGYEGLVNSAHDKNPLSGRT